MKPATSSGRRSQVPPPPKPRGRRRYAFGWKRTQPKSSYLPPPNRWVKRPTPRLVRTVPSSARETLRNRRVETRVVPTGWQAPGWSGAGGAFLHGAVEAPPDGLLRRVSDTERDALGLGGSRVGRLAGTGGQGVVEAHPSLKAQRAEERGGALRSGGRPDRSGLWRSAPSNGEPLAVSASNVCRQTPLIEVPGTARSPLRRAGSFTIRSPASPKDPQPT